MSDAKYIGMDVHQATISVAVRDSRGNLVMEAILETKAETILQFIRGLRASLYVAFEEGTWAAWLHDLLQPHVALIVHVDFHFSGYATTRPSPPFREAWTKRPPSVRCDARHRGRSPGGGRFFRVSLKNNRCAMG